MQLQTLGLGDASTDDARKLAVVLLVRIIERRQSFDNALAHPKATPLTHELLYGVCRHYFSLQERITRHLSMPLRKKDLDVLCLLFVGTLQLVHMRVPAHAAVHTAVEISRKLNKPWAAKLINAVLRSVQRDTRELVAPEAQFDHPSWLVRRVRDEYPDLWQDLLCANQTRAPLALRVNRSQSNQETALGRLSADGVTATPGRVPGSLTLSKPSPSDRLSVIGDGLASIQDEGAQLAALLLAPTPGMRVLDACAAPGNKTTHLLECAPTLQLTCVDSNAARLPRVAEECMRLKLPEPRIVHSTLEQLDWWDGRPFDAILLDVPCSGTGTLRRHPDIKLRLQPRDVTQHQATQKLLLNAAWRTLGKGGRLLYSTCSMLKQENDDVLEDFFVHASAQRLAMPLLHSGGLAHRRLTHGIQLLPQEDGPDAMYYSLIAKV